MPFKEPAALRSWPSGLRSTFVQIASLAYASLIHTRALCANSPLPRVQLLGKLDRTRTQLAVANEVIRVLRARMDKVPARNRPTYPPVERMAIVELRAAQGWSVARTAEVFQVSPETIRSWCKRLDEQGEDALVQTPVPINRLPDAARYVAARMKVLCPSLGTKKLAQILTHAGLAISKASVGRILKNPPPRPPCPRTPQTEATRTVTAKRPNHVWNVDLTVVPTHTGLASAFFPYSLPQVWPFAWVVATVIDHFSRRVQGLEVFKHEPTAEQLTRFLDQTISEVGHAPRHMISDKGTQFVSEHYRKWCDDAVIKSRYGAVGRYGSIAIIERFFRSLKTEYTRNLLVPISQKCMRAAMLLHQEWFNKHRPHQGLDGLTPQDVYEGRSSNVEPVDLRDPTNGPLQLVVTHHRGSPLLPVVTLRKAA
ncbi:MAG: DDE-type integrase/transposase/recombinase [Planctomycetota bacterium]